MAIAKMEKLSLSFKAELLDDILQLMQGFQGIHIETGFESTIPPSQKGVIDKEIRIIEKDLSEIQAAQSVLKGRDSSNIIHMLRSSGEQELSIKDLVRIVEESDWEQILEEVIVTDRKLTDNHTRRAEINEMLEELVKWECLSSNPVEFPRLERSRAVVGSVHENHRSNLMERLDEFQEEGVYYEVLTDVEDRVYFFLIYHVSMDQKVQDAFDETSFSSEIYPFSKNQAETRHDLEQEQKDLLAEEKILDQLIVEQHKYKDILTFAEDYCLNSLIRKKKSLEITYRNSRVEVDGWILADKRHQFEESLRMHFKRSDYSIETSPILEEDIDEVPIKLQNNKLVTVYERLTAMYSLPKYNEIDPTPIMTIFYLLFFGMMVADVGYGLAVLLISLVVKKVFKVKRSTRSFVDFLYYLSFPMMGWGLIYGSFCGMSLPFGFIDVTVDIIPMTMIAIGLGYFHIMAGLILQMFNQAKLKNYFDMLTGGLAWFLTFLGGGIMILATVVPFLGQITWYMGTVILVIGLGMTILVPAVQYGKRWYMGIGKGLYSLYGATSYLGDFVSYSRLMALGVAGGSVALAFNTILAFLPLPARLTLGVILAIILHGLNIFLSLLSAYVHGIRLQFIEFFGKFYQGGGKRFDPFKAAEKNVIITEEE